MSQVIPLQSGPANGSIALSAAIREYLASGDFQRSTVEVYARTLDALLEDAGGDVLLARITRQRLEAHLRRRYGHCAPATYNRHLATTGSLFSWAVERDLLPSTPPRGSSVARSGAAGCRSCRPTPWLSRTSRPCGATRVTGCGIAPSRPWHMPPRPAPRSC